VTPEAVKLKLPAMNIFGAAVDVVAPAAGATAAVIAVMVPLVGEPATTTNSLIAELYENKMPDAKLVDEAG
jgi:hypothetical protein